MKHKTILQALLVSAVMFLPSYAMADYGINAGIPSTRSLWLVNPGTKQCDQVQRSGALVNLFLTTGTNNLVVSSVAPGDSVGCDTLINAQKFQIVLHDTPTTCPSGTELKPGGPAKLNACIPNNIWVTLSGSCTGCGFTYLDATQGLSLGIGG